MQFRKNSKQNTIWDKYRLTKLQSKMRFIWIYSNSLTQTIEKSFVEFWFLISVPNTIVNLYKTALHYKLLQYLFNFLFHLMLLFSMKLTGTPVIIWHAPHESRGSSSSLKITVQLLQLFLSLRLSCPALLLRQFLL